MKRSITCIVTSMIIVFGLCGCQTATVNIQSETIENKENIDKEAAPTEIAEEIVTPTPTPETTETPIPETVQEEEAEVSENENNDDIEEEVDELTARTESLDKTMYANQNCNVRSGDSTDYERIGGLNFAQEVKVVGLSSTGWYKIELGDDEFGYVSGKLLSDNKPSAQKQQSSSGGGSAAQTAPAQQAAPAGNGGHTRQATNWGVGATVVYTGEPGDGTFN